MTERRLSEALVVALTLHGPVLPEYGEDPAVPLGLPELARLGHLSRVSSDREQFAHEGTTEDAASRGAADLVAALEERRLLTSPGREPQAPASGPSTTGTIEPAPLGPESEVLVLPSPVLLRVRDGRFELADHDGRLLLRLHPVEVLALGRFPVGTTVSQAHADHVTEAGPWALDRRGFDDLVGRARRAGVLLPFQWSQADTDAQASQADAMRDSIRRKAQVTNAFDQLEREAGTAGADGRVPVYGVHTYWSSAPASLGTLLAYARVYREGALKETFDFRPRLAFDAEQLAATTDVAGIYLFSNYIWSTTENLALSAQVKAANPASVCIHGGPNTPKYPPDVARFFADHPHVDITVHGEGEQTFVELLEVLAGHVGDGPADLSPLRDVAGLTFRDGDQLTTTGARDRVADLDVLPSPVLAGLFDGFIPAGPLGGVAIETNRGCPYGCTFCDWGSATLSRVRKFDLDRIFAEIEWCARNQIQTIGICDANFGIFERDVEIAEHIAQLKTTYGYPVAVGNNYAKNTVKHLSKIIDIFTQAGIVAEGKMSMQSFDPGTLSVIHRKNIKVEKYDELSVEFRRNRLPMSVDLMLGLPGSTPASFRDDLQSCIDRDVRVLIHPTMLLPNSPMNDPEYRQEHGIVARPGEYVRQTASYTGAQWEQMHRLGAGVWLFENFGILRQVATYVRAETGIREVDFYARLIEDAEADAERWPLVRVAIEVLPHTMVPPVSWRFFLDEIRRHLVEVEGISDDDALETVLAVQHALLPARDRTFPVEMALDHDYVAWRNDVLEARDEAHRQDWPSVVVPLRRRGPGHLEVDDPHHVCNSALDGSLAALVHESSWDFDSPVSRPRQRTYGSPGDDGARTTTRVEVADRPVVGTTAP